MSYIPMIDPETGEVDEALVQARAAERVARDYSDRAVPPAAALRSELEWCRARAVNERLDWRRRRGLPDDSPVEMVMLPAWGASGDSFGRR